MKTPGKRIFYLDSLRAFLVVLVIIHHTAITYGGAGGWFYHEDFGENLLTSILLTFIVSVNQSFFMGLLFFVAGYFTPGSFERKRAGGFLKDRLIRLGLPLVFYVIFFSPYLSYQQLAREQGLRSSYVQFWLTSLAHPQNLGLGPLWFIEALLIFALAYVVWAKTIARTPTPTDKVRTFTNKTVIAIAVVLAITTGVVRIFFSIGDEVLSLQLAFFAQYIAFFILGVIAYRYNRLEGVPVKVITFWRRVIVAGLLLWPVLLVAGGAMSGNIEPFEGGLYWQSFAYAAWEMFFGIAMSIFLLDYFRRKLDTAGGLWKPLTSSAYTVYIIHPVVVVPVTLALAGIKVFPFLKFLVMAPALVALTFAVGYLIKRLPVARKIL